MSEEPRILTETQDGIFVVTINRPHVMNALCPQAHRDMAAAFDLFEADPTLRVAILTGAGEKAFCVGSDIREDMNRDLKPSTGFGGLTRRFDMRKPVIAVVNGLALGGGMELISACDLAVAADSASFALPEPRVGLAAIEGGIQRLVRQLPQKRAMAMLLTCERISAQQALDWGLVNHVAPIKEIMSKAHGLAREIMKSAPLSIEATKAVALSSLNGGQMQSLDLWRHEAIEKMWYSADATEGMAAFAAKRPPLWSGR